MLENQLLLAVVFEQPRILVKRAYFACEFDSADQVYRDRSLIFADRIKKRVLNVLCRLIAHVPISNFLKCRVTLWKMLKHLQLLQSRALRRSRLKSCYRKFTRLPRLRSGLIRPSAQKPCTGAI